MKYEYFNFKIRVLRSIRNFDIDKIIIFNDSLMTLIIAAVVAVTYPARVCRPFNETILCKKNTKNNYIY